MKIRDIAITLLTLAVAGSALAFTPAKTEAEKKKEEFAAAIKPLKGTTSPGKEVRAIVKKFPSMTVDQGKQVVSSLQGGHKFAAAAAVRTSNGKMRDVFGGDDRRHFDIANAVQMASGDAPEGWGTGSALTDKEFGAFEMAMQPVSGKDKFFELNLFASTYDWTTAQAQKLLQICPQDKKEDLAVTLVDRLTDRKEKWGNFIGTMTGPEREKFVKKCNEQHKNCES